MKRAIVQLLLAILNSRWLNASPCKYEFVGNIDAFSRSDIESNIRTIVQAVLPRDGRWSPRKDEGE